MHDEVGKLKKQNEQGEEDKQNHNFDIFYHEKGYQKLWSKFHI